MAGRRRTVTTLGVLLAVGPETGKAAPLLHDCSQLQAEAVAVRGCHGVPLLVVATHQGEHAGRFGEGGAVQVRVGG